MQSDAKRDNLQHASEVVSFRLPSEVAAHFGSRAAARYMSRNLYVRMLVIDLYRRQQGEQNGTRA